MASAPTDVELARKWLDYEHIAVTADRVTSLVALLERVRADGAAKPAVLQSMREAVASLDSRQRTASTPPPAASQEKRLR
jgi:hypothetical protein